MAELGVTDTEERGLGAMPLSMPFARRDVERLRDLAVRYGALITVAVMDLALADIGLGSFDRELCLSAATSCAVARD